MAAKITPHFHNSNGLKQIAIGSREFQCVGAKPPFDHPHVYLDMGGDTDIVCPYCSTHYVLDTNLKDGEANPADCVLDIAPAA